MGRGKTNKHAATAWLEADIKRKVSILAHLKGISVSEYVRSLILSDLDERTVFTTALKEDPS